MLYITYPTPIIQKSPRRGWVSFFPPHVISGSFFLTTVTSGLPNGNQIYIQNSVQHVMCDKSFVKCAIQI